MPAPLDSASTRVRFDIDVRLPGNQFVPITDYKLQFLDATVIESIDGPAKASMTLRVNSVQFVNRTLPVVSSEGNPRLRFRIGLGSGGTVDYLPWQEHYILNPRSITEGLGSNTGHTFTIETIDSMWPLIRNTKTIKRQGTVSSIVRQIADEHRMKYVIEETVGEGLWIQSFMSDSDFIRQRMLPRALNKRNRGNYHFYIRDNTLHFHSLDYQANVEEIKYYDSACDNLVLSDHSQEMVGNTGASGALMTFYNPYTGDSGTKESLTQNKLRFANSTPDLDAVPYTSKDLFYQIGINPVWEVEAIVQNKYESDYARMFEVQFEQKKQIRVHAGDVVNFNLQSRNISQTTWGGPYAVYSATHAIVKSSITSRFSMRRGEQQISQRDFALEGALNASTAADGQPVNTRALSASQLTKGAATQSGPFTFVTSQNPD